MFKAINAITGELVSSINPEHTDEFYKKEKWYAPPQYIEEIPKDIDKTKVEVSWRYGSQYTKKSNLNTISKRPHFYLFDNKIKGLKLYKNTKEHEEAVDFLINIIKNKKVIITTNKFGIEKQVDIYKNLDIDKFDCETRVANENKFRIIDITLPFKEFSPIFGVGIAIEIQLTKQNKIVIKNRTIDRSLFLYSTVWISKEEYDCYKKELLIPKLVLILYSDNLLNSIDERLNLLHEYSKNYLYSINNKTTELKEKIKELQDPEIIPCKICNKGYCIKKIAKNTGKKYWKCSYNECSNIMWG